MPKDNRKISRSGFAKAIRDVMLKNSKKTKNFSDIPNRMLRRKYKKAGLLFGAKTVMGVKYHVGKRPDDDGHFAGFGGSGIANDVYKQEAE